MIQVDNISKTFRIPHERRDTLREIMLGFFRPVQYEKFAALKNVSFTVDKGQWYGVIGRNGSGKSTLLKILAGIYTPDEGKVHIQGRVIPLLELGVGFHPELTVLQNIFFNAALLGISRTTTKQLIDSILAFAELERFRDQQLKNLSSGMQVRLAFSVAIQAKGDVYLLDEVLAVGDFIFQRKCAQVFSDLKKQGKTVILVSHSIQNILNYCDHCIWFENGMIAQNAPAAITCDNYENRKGNVIG
jgi:ABC-2 type transport system ATP-binding protein